MSKEAFVKEFGKFLIENVPYYSDIKSLVYLYDEKSGEEWVYCNYSAFAQKRVCVTADSEKAIMVDFFNNIEDNPWISPIDKEIYEKE